MKRRDFLSLAAAPALPALAWAQEKSKLKITYIKMVKTGPCDPYPTYQASGWGLVHAARRSRQPRVDLSGIQAHALAVHVRRSTTCAEFHRGNQHR